MTARTIGRSNGAPPARTMLRITVVPFGPRTLARAWSEVNPSTVAPSMATIRSSASSPAFAAGASGVGSTTMNAQPSPMAAQAPSPLTRRRLDLGADPFELAGQALERLAVLLRAEIGRERVVEGADHPADRSVDQLLVIDRPTGVVLGDRPVGVPERLERGRLVDRRARGRRLEGSEGEAGHEQGAAGQDGDDDEREMHARRPACPSGIGRRRCRWRFGWIEGGCGLGGRLRVGHRSVLGAVCGWDGPHSVRRAGRKGCGRLTSGGSSGPTPTIRGPRARSRS